MCDQDGNEVRIKLMKFILQMLILREVFESDQLPKGGKGSQGGKGGKGN